MYLKVQLGRYSLLQLNFIRLNPGIDILRCNSVFSGVGGGGGGGSLLLFCLMIL